MFYETSECPRGKYVLHIHLLYFDWGVEPGKSHGVGRFFCSVSIQKSFFPNGAGGVKERIVYEGSALCEGPGRRHVGALLGKRKLRPGLLRGLRPGGFSYLLSRSGTKQEPVDKVQLSQGESKFQ